MIVSFELVDIFLVFGSASLHFSLFNHRKRRAFATEAIFWNLLVLHILLILVFPRRQPNVRYSSVLLWIVVHRTLIPHLLEANVITQFTKTGTRSILGILVVIALFLRFRAFKPLKLRMQIIKLSFSDERKSHALLSTILLILWIILCTQPTNPTFPTKSSAHPKNQDSSSRLNRINHITDSSIDLNFHPGIHEVVMRMRFTVLAHYALTLLATLRPSPVAIAIVFSTSWLFTSAAPLGNPSRYTLESARMSKIGQLLSFVNLQLAVFLVAADVALTFLIAQPSFRETLAIHFKTVDFTAFTALLRHLAWRQIHLRDSA